MSFLQDPLIEWRTSLSRHQQQQQQQQQQNEAAATKTGERKAYACIVAIQKKLQGCISVLPPGAFEESVQPQQQQQQHKQQKQLQRDDDSSSSEDSFVESEEEEPNISGATGAAAVAAAAAPQSSSGTLGVYAQVAALIRSASSVDNLAKMYDLG
ncbi:hypothetical protein, conserved [Eimeria maxima]|uniref:FATC domain-containing protein n=1 Tax=Eimeria maxima TaxID=5804 RepID=U6M3H6_EIMMA|nr:hypothetical protein, conserved [Eimeria maxima]CDJ56250.1 hypothetical protein, conserved [Eimeria maxima]